MSRIVLLVLVSVASACGSRAPASLPAAATSTTEDTTLGPGDVFEVTVFGQEELSGKYKVGQDGSIRFPFLGLIMAGGKEPEILAQDLASGLREGGFLQDPQVSVLVEQSNSKRLSVLGAVAKPGTFAIIPGMTLIQAISQAGGFTALADKDGTVVTRRVDGKLERYRVPVGDITRGDSEDFAVRPGDIVFVPERIF